MSPRLPLRGVATCVVFLGLSPLFGDTVGPAATPCLMGNLSSLVVSSDGCTLGGESSVSGLNFTASIRAPLNASDITVTPTESSYSLI